MSETGGRLIALDAFRGMTIAGMILVNNPGDWGTVYAPLLHARWHGWTPTDLVFPFFLFIVGVAIAFALGRRLEAGAEQAPIVRKIVKRGAVLFGLGLFLAAYPRIFTEPLDTLAHLRIPGVLQRIAVCYVIVALLYLRYRLRTLATVCAGCLFGYWIAMAFGGGSIDVADGHLAARVDRLVLGEDHLWRQARTWDPEGLLSTVPAIATTLFGLFTGVLLRSDRPLPEKVLELFKNGTLLVVAGYVWSWFFPINKPIWTSSYAVLTAGQAMCALALCVWACDIKGRRAWAEPFVVYGINAITVFVGSGLLARTLTWISWDSDGATTTLKGWIYRHAFESWLSGAQASLAYALVWVVGWYVVLRAMHRRGIVIKV